MAALTGTATVSDAFSLTLLALDVVAAGGGGGSRAGSGAPLLPGSGGPQARLSLAFSFLDYPPVVIHADDTEAAARLERIGFGRGKSCALRADAGELLFLARKVRAGGRRRCLS
jgi:hypothetical protein